MLLQRHHQHFFKFFLWERGVTPASSPSLVAGLVAGYLLLVAVGRWAIKRPLSLPKAVPAAHNFVLCVGSLVMFIGTAHESYRESNSRGSNFWLFCLPPGTAAEGPLYFWSYVYYLSKYYEFFDTFILIWKAKPLTFLHVFHHALVVVMAYLWLDQAQSLQQIALLTNAFIHVIMYLYYMLSSLGMHPPWKQLVTVGQIVQFVFSFAVSVPFWILHYSQGGCSGFEAMVFNAVFNFILLVLFINFQRQTYSNKRKKA